MRLALTILAILAFAAPASALTAGPRECVPPVETPVLNEDAAAFLQRLVDRYRELDRYRDRTRITHTLEHEGDTTQRLDTAITCTIEGGELEVRTPARQVAGALGLHVPLRFGAPATAWRDRFDLWLAPHLALWLDEAPAQMLGRATEEPLRPTTTTDVIVEDRPLVHVTLEARGESDDAPAATVDLYVNRDSMLIERLESAQRLADGSSLHTTLDITPLEAALRTEDDDFGEPALEPTVRPDDPAPATPAPAAPPTPAIGPAPMPAPGSSLPPAPR